MSATTPTMAPIHAAATVERLILGTVGRLRGARPAPGDERPWSGDGYVHTRHGRGVVLPLPRRRVRRSRAGPLGPGARRRPRGARRPPRPDERGARRLPALLL